MRQLNLILLGGFQARLGSGPILSLRSRRAQAVLSYLALPAGRAHSRDEIASLLWGHLAQEEARNRLRQALFALRRSLTAASPPCLRLDGDTLSVDPAALEVDARTLERCVSEGSASALERAAALYRGELLQGLPAQGPHPSAFEEWLGAERERMRELAIEAFAKLVNIRRAAGTPEQALATALQLLALDPLQEAIHRTVMRLHLQLGRRTAALRQYQTCVNLLRRELHIGPEEETRRLYRDVLRRRPRLAPADHGHGPLGSAFAASPIDDTPLVGREAETALFRTWLAGASCGKCQVAFLVGETGAGKSRLAAALAAESTDAEEQPVPFRVLVGRCHDGEHLLAFGPWIDAFRAAGLPGDRALLETLAPVWLAELVRLLPELGSAGVAGPAGLPDAPRLFEGIRQLIAALTRRSPVVLILEDLHWADHMSLRLLQFLARRTSGWPLVLAGTMREEELADLPALRQTLESLEGEPHVARLRVAPLSRRATFRLVRALSSARSEPAQLAPLSQHAWRVSQGNPFVVVETVRALQHGIAIAGPTGLPLAERVRHTIARRLDRLSEVGRDLVAVAAVIGRRFEFALLQLAGAREDAAAAAGVEELVRRQVLHEVAGGLDFVHERVRSALCAELLSPRRRLLHRQVAEAIETLYAADLDRHLLALGMHCREGELWEKAVGYLRRAGLRAAERSAHREATACFEAALVALGHLGRNPHTLEQAVDIRLDLRSSLNPLGDMTLLHEHLREAEALARGLGDWRRLGRAAAFMTQTFAVMGDHRAAAQCGQRALDIAEAVGDFGLRVIANYFLHQSHYFSGRYREALEGLRWNIASLQGDLQHERFGSSTYPSIVSRAGLATCLAELGEFAEGAAHGEQAVRMAEAVDHPYSLIQACWAVSTVYLRRGDGHSAIPLLERAVALCRLRDIPRQLFPSRAFLGFAYASASRREEAVRQLEQAEALREKWGATATWTRWVAEGFWLVGHLEAAGRIAGWALARSRETDEQGNRAWLVRLFGELDLEFQPPDLTQAEAHYREALAEAARLGMRPLMAHCHLGLGRVCRDMGEREQAHEHLATARAMYSDMNMAPWLDRVEADFRAQETARSIVTASARAAASID